MIYTAARALQFANVGAIRSKIFLKTWDLDRLAQVLTELIVMVLMSQAIVDGPRIANNKAIGVDGLLINLCLSFFRNISASFWMTIGVSLDLMINIHTTKFRLEVNRTPAIRMMRRGYRG